MRIVEMDFIVLHNIYNLYTFDIQFIYIGIYNFDYESNAPQLHEIESIICILL